MLPKGVYQYTLQPPIPRGRNPYSPFSQNTEPNSLTLLNGLPFHSATRKIKANYLRIGINSAVGVVLFGVTRWWIRKRGSNFPRTPRFCLLSQWILFSVCVLSVRPNNFIFKSLGERKYWCVVYVVMSLVFKHTKLLRRKRDEKGSLMGGVGLLVWVWELCYLTRGNCWLGLGRYLGGRNILEALWMGIYVDAASLLPCVTLLSLSTYSSIPCPHKKKFTTSCPHTPS